MRRVKDGNAQGGGPRTCRAHAGPPRARLVCPAQEEFKTQEMWLQLASPLAHVGPPEGPRLSSFYEGGHGGPRGSVCHPYRLCVPAGLADDGLPLHEEMGLTGPLSSFPPRRTQTPPPRSGVCGHAPPRGASLSPWSQRGPGGPAPPKPPGISGAPMSPHLPGHQ